MQTLYKLSEYYKYIIDHLVNTELEVHVLDQIFKKYQVKTVLDVACGVGRHAIPLAKLGYTVTAIDSSPYQIKKARFDARKEKVRAKFTVRDANAFYYPKKFGAAICMWTTMGEEPMQYKKVIKNVFYSLKKGGIFVVDNRSWEHIPKSKKQIIQNTIKTDNGIVIKSRIYDRYTKNFRIRDALYNINKKQYKDLCITYLLKERDWAQELREAGFRKFEVLYDHKNKKIKRPSYVTIIAVK